MHPRSEATNSLTWSGELQLRRNRMKPTGSAARKKSRSKALRLSPEQPKMTARGASLRNDAPDIAPLQLTADPVGVGDGGRLDAVEYPLVTEIGTDRDRRKATEQIRIRPLDAIPFLACHVLAAHRAELDPGSAGFRRRQLSGRRLRRRGGGRRGLTGWLRPRLLRLGRQDRARSAGRGRRR